MVVGYVALIRRSSAPARWSPTARAARRTPRSCRSSRACAGCASWRRWRCRWPTTPRRRCRRRSTCRSRRSRRRTCSTRASCRPASTSATRRPGSSSTTPSAQVRITLPPPRILSIDIQRFETINEESGFLNAISPEDRNRWYGEARAALERGALAQGALDRAPDSRARSCSRRSSARHGYTLVIGSGPARRTTAVVTRRAGPAPKGCRRDEGGCGRAPSSRRRRRWSACRRGTCAARGKSKARPTRPRRASWTVLHRQRRDGALVVAAGAGGRADDQDLAVGDGAGELTRRPIRTATSKRADRGAAATVRRPACRPSSPRRAPARYQVIWRRGGKPIACRKIAVAAKPAAPATSVGANVWPAAHAWDRRYENFYSAWIATLFDAPVEAVAGLPAAAPGAARSGAQLPLRTTSACARTIRRTRPRSPRRPTAPTCRTSCARISRGSWGCRSGSATATAAPNRGRRAARRSTATTTRRPGKDTLAAVKSFFRQLANRVQSGSARTGLDDDATDYYPVPLERDGAAPGASSTPIRTGT